MIESCKKTVWGKPVTIDVVNNVKAIEENRGEQDWKTVGEQRFRKYAFIWESNLRKISEKIYCQKWEKSGRKMSTDQRLTPRGAFCLRQSSSSFFWWDIFKKILLIFLAWHRHSHNLFSELPSKDLCTYFWWDIFQKILSTFLVSYL